MFITEEDVRMTMNLEIHKQVSDVGTGIELAIR